MAMDKSDDTEDKKGKPGRTTLTENQEQFCKLIIQGKPPLEAMLEVFPNRKSYSKGNQNMLVKKLQNNPKVIKRLEELFVELRNNEVLGDMYNFDKGVKLLTSEIERAEAIIAEGTFNEALHRVILSSIQELNRMYGFNLIDKNGKAGGTVNVTFVNVDKPEGDVKIGKE